MSDQCNHDCGNCSSKCPSAIEKDAPHVLSTIDKVYAVVSGKGGVGKSLVTALLAVETERKGLRAAVLDADITGPSVPRMFGATAQAMSTEDGILPVTSAKGTQIISINNMLEDETDPVIWRGPMIAGVVRQFWTDVIWHDVDYMFVDMPPGTGDVPLTVMQSLPIDGIIVVTSPQELVGMIVQKAVKMAEAMQVPVVALVENMSYFDCPDCGKRHAIFGDSQLDQIAAKYNIAHIARLPIDPEFAKLCDKGGIEATTHHELADLLDVL
jgi:Mrp family chromosome partitioning ATPase